MIPDPYPNGQGEGLEDLGSPVLAFDEADLMAQLQRTGWPWPPYAHVEAPPCGHRNEVAAEHTTDGRPRVFYCDRPSHEGGPHRCVVDLQEGTALSWQIKSPVLWASP